MRKERSLRKLRVFTDVVGDDRNSLLHHSPEDWHAYAEGYKRGADALVRRVLETHGEWDYLVYPICFCYRHYLELILKQIIRRGGAVVDEPDDVRPQHPLLPLWKRAKTITGKLWPDEDVARVEQVIREFDEVDREAYAFRYPVDTHGQEHLADLKAVNVQHLARVVNEISPFLSGAGYGIEEARDAKAEGAQYYDHYDDYEPSED